MFTRDIERLVHELLHPNTDVEYIRYYLMDEFQLDAKTIDIVFEKVGLVGQEGNPMAMPSRRNEPRASFAAEGLGRTWLTLTSPDRNSPNRAPRFGDSCTPRSRNVAAITKIDYLHEGISSPRFPRVCLRQTSLAHIERAQKRESFHATRCISVVVR